MLRAYRAEKPIIIWIINLILKKLFVCSLAAFYYFEHQGVPIEQALKQNGIYLAEFLVFTSISEVILSKGLLILFSEEHSFNKQSWETGPMFIYRIWIPVLSILFIFFYMSALISVPLLAYCDFKIAMMDTDYWTVRYIYQISYLVARHVPYMAIDDMKTLIADGVLLP